VKDISHLDKPVLFNTIDFRAATADLPIYWVPSCGVPHKEKEKKVIDLS
jgi:hypothetical protein